MKTLREEIEAVCSSYENEMLQFMTVSALEPNPFLKKVWEAKALDIRSKHEDIRAILDRTKGGAE